MRRSCALDRAPACPCARDTPRRCCGRVPWPDTSRYRRTSTDRSAPDRDRDTARRQSKARSPPPARRPGPTASGTLPAGVAPCLRRRARPPRPQDHREFVAAEARDGVAFAYDLTQTRAGRLQHAVAGGVAHRIVDVLEAIQIEEQHRDLVIAAARIDDRVAQPFAQ